MTELRKVVRMMLEGKSQREIERMTGLARTSIRTYKERAEQSGMSLEELLKLEDEALHSLLRKGGGHRPADTAKRDSLEPLLADMAKRKARSSHLTYDVLYEEYCGKVSEAYGYTQFKLKLQEYEQRNGLSYHNTYLPGREMQVDFAGDTLYVTDPETGERSKANVLVCVLPFSGLAYVKALGNMRMESFFHALSGCLTAVGGAPEIVKSDNMKQWVKRYDRYDPELNAEAEKWALHYNTQMENCRVRKPRDKGPVEGAVYQVYRYIYSRIECGRGDGHPEVFHSLEGLNARLTELTEEFNARKMHGKSYSRQERFEALERDALRPLPATPYTFRYEKVSKVPSSYHIQITTDGKSHYYSVPYQYVNSMARTVFDLDTVEIWVGFNRVAIHQRSLTEGYTTDPSHMPESHREYQAMQGTYNAGYFIERAKQIGPSTTEVMEGMLASKVFPQQAYKSCHGLLSLLRHYCPARIEKACSLIPNKRHARYTQVRDILSRNIDLNADAPKPRTSYMPDNDDVRGPETYQ
ncbi:MAG: IS21 family transposase [Bacteroidales bacterium]|nr:IS21 family transposase [Bacteroidales bacterium]